MLNKVIESMNKEYETLKSLLDPIEGADWALENPKRLINNAQHRMVGVGMFAQEYLGVKYEDLNPFFEEMIKKMDKLVDK